jgi:hypothetical protein
MIVFSNYIVFATKVLRHKFFIKKYLFLSFFEHLWLINYLFSIKHIRKKSINRGGFSQKSRSNKTVFRLSHSYGKFLLIYLSTYFSTPKLLRLAKLFLPYIPTKHLRQLTHTKLYHHNQHC